MGKRYKVGPRETIKSIARKQLGSASRAAELADYNGIVGREALEAGEIIEIPSRRDRARNLAPRARSISSPPPPHGYSGIVETFGDLSAFVAADGSLNPDWQTRNITRIDLPFSLPLDWDPSKSVTRISCHRLIAPLLTDLFAQITSNGLLATLKTYGGAYNYRTKRNGAKPSTHSWGIAVDFNVRTNQMGTDGDMDPRLVQFMEGFGFLWGGRWTGRGKDPMHFQYCTGY